MVCDFTIISSQHYSVVVNMKYLLYVIVATSELVVKVDGPATRVGRRATIRSLLFKRNIKTLLYPPSFFS